jgi:hypothetical protein
VTEDFDVRGFVLYFPRIYNESIKPVVEETEQRNTLVFWQNRLVPQTINLLLPFYPKVKEVTKSNVVWGERVVAFLFLDWSFPYISNNKLKINLLENEWINNKQTFTKAPKNAKEKFIK